MRTSGSDRRGSDRAKERPTASAQAKSDLRDLSGSLLAKLGRTLETQIIPRFMLAFESDKRARTAAAELDLGERVEELVHIVLQHDAPVASEYVDTLRQQGFPLADIYLDLLAPAARRLGEMWEYDDVSFAEVAIGVCRMHQVLLDFSRCFDPIDCANSDERSALIVPTPGEEHTFGLFLVVEFLRRAGWHCWTGSPRTEEELLKLLESQRFDAIGLSVSTDRYLEQTGHIIAEIRRCSEDNGPAIVLGGRVPNENAELVSQLGADGSAEDGKAAVRVMNELCGVGSGATASG